VRGPQRAGLLHRLGSHAYSASATDVAGNTGHGCTSFSVTVTFTSLAALVTRFSTDPAVTKGLNDKLAAAAAATNKTARDKQLEAFISQVRAHIGKAFTTAQAQVLIQLAKALE
jgi:hypothetical protein